MLTSSEERHNLNYYSRHKVGLIERAYIRITNYFRLKEILSHVPPKRPLSLLDVGCGNGTFLDDLPSTFTKTGIDLHPPQGKSDTDYIKGSFESHKFTTRFDVITANHVIEHLDHPEAFLKKVNKILNDDGVFVLSTPNTDSLGYKIASKKWYHFDYPHHIKLYNPSSLSLILENSNFSKLKIIGEFPGFPFDFIHTLKNMGISYLFLSPLLFIGKIFFPETIVAICKKR